MLVPSIGEHLTAAVGNLSSAVAIDDPAIEVENADEIRFRISQPVWLEGVKLPDWAAEVRSALAKAQTAGQ